MEFFIVHIGISKKLVPDSDNKGFSEEISYGCLIALPKP